ncbi:HupE/UreJ family protein [Rhodobacteraceae bacterium]|nr:HupE/UreJ family protein [Paracoccaceae bacterium]
MTKFLSNSVVIRVMLVALLSTLFTVTALRAHEVQPGVMDIEIGAQDITAFLEWTIEAPVAGIDLETIEDTDASDQEEEYLRLRALSPAELEEAFRAAWPGLADKLTLRAGETNLTPELADITIPEVGNVEIARTSTIELLIPLPAGDDPIVIGWTKDLGALIVRQRTIENGYAGFLTPGQLSDPIPRTGGVEQGFVAALVSYISVGFDHIVPQGLDHILFVLGLFFLSLRMRPLLLQVTAFTLAHTVTLALGALDLIRLPGDIVEPIIAASIVYVGLENVFIRKLAPWRPFVVFGFGLLHGLGFASVLQEFGLGEDNFVAKLIGFNVGVEVGQLAVIAAAWLAFALLFGRNEWFHRRIGAPVSIGIAVIAAFWVLERTDTIATTGSWGLFSALTEGGFAPVTVLIVAAALAGILTVLVLLIITADGFRDLAGMATSFVLFLCVIAAFTSGAWIISLAITGIWVIALRLQSLGGPEAEPELT